MIYIIGGAPRCGKTKLANKLSKKLGAPVFSTDLLRIKIMKSTRIEEVYNKFPFEKMFNGDNVDDCFRLYEPIDFVNADRSEASTIFHVLKKLIKQKIKNGQDMIIEGVHLLPEYINEFGLTKKNSKAIYLGKLSVSAILDGLILNKDKNDWIVGHINKRVSLKKAALMVREYGKYFEAEAMKHGFEFVNTEVDFLKIINKTANNLFNVKQNDRA